MRAPSAGDEARREETWVGNGDHDIELKRASDGAADLVLQRFFDADGRLLTIPAKQSRQIAMYDLLAQRFVPGVRYTELEVNRELMAVYADYVSLRRGLVDFGFLDRADGQYWRSGGSVPVGEDHAPEATGTTSGGPVPATTTRAGVRRGSPGATPRTTSPRGVRRREAIVAAASGLIAERGYAAVGMDDIGAAAGVTGPAIYRHFDSKAAVLAEVFERVIDSLIDAVTPHAAESDGAGSANSTIEPVDAARALTEAIDRYATGVSARRRLIAVFLREVHHLPAEQGERLVTSQRHLIGRWRELLAAAHPDWSVQRVRTAVHGAFGLLNSVGTYESPLTDAELAAELTGLTRAALAV